MVKVSSQAARESFRWQFFVVALQELPLADMAKRVKQGLSLQRSAIGKLVVGVLAIALIYWHGRLFFATGAGVGVMLLVYLMHDWQPDLDLSGLRKLLEGWNQPFVVSSGAGAIATLCTYMAVSVWHDSASAWIASGAILQALGTLTVLLTLAWQLLHRQEPKPRRYHQLVSDLVHEDSLRRLIAVRQLTDIISVLQDEPPRRPVPAKKPSRREISDYFRLMLTREPDAIVREALFDGLQTVEIVRQLKQATAAPIHLSPRKHAPVKPLALAKVDRRRVLVED